MKAFSSLVLIFIFKGFITETSAAIDPCDLPTFCQTGIIAPDPHNCSGFLICVHGMTWQKMPCIEELCFDVNSNACERQPCNCTAECRTYTGPTTVEASEATVVPGTCFEVAECEEGEKFADRSDCEFYFECDKKNNTIRKQCHHEVFDIYAMDCITPSSDFNCEYRCPTTAPDTTTFEATTFIDTTSRETAEHPTSLIPTESPAIDPCDLPEYCDEGTTVANPNDCKTYLFCHYGTTWIERSCPVTLCYDVTANACTYEPCQCAAECPLNTGPSTEAASGTAPIPGTCHDIEECEFGEKFADESDCEFYFECLFNNQIRRRQCGGTMVFDIHTLQCIIPSSDFNCEYRCLTTVPDTLVPIDDPFSFV
ncbi:hypothetical protein CAPTEDRAFT_205713 [Capitella teleta]|uniref:Chitin-binding type-2 domain-containing protein n=1 Tax=Capitella teleta TaxID=283909 RepID=R7U1I3_CAPTE|nr:hypothetical protein CAPTEDRAFT_205713 [Capitella teleta]|eukprot:ELT97055.1 hypothetical protein CAPTEDRAFT_205713 [Capitella teleta]